MTVQKNFQIGHCIVHIEKLLRFLNRHKNKGRIIFVHADGKSPPDRIRTHARHGTESGDRSFRRNQRNFLTDINAQLLCQTIADDNRAGFGKSRRRAADNTVGQNGSFGKILRPHTTNNRPLRAAHGADHHLPFNQRHHHIDAFDRRGLPGQSFVIIQNGAVHGINAQMPV